jgi:hypothetical protein
MRAAGARAGLDQEVIAGRRSCISAAWCGLSLSVTDPLQGGEMSQHRNILSRLAIASLAAALLAAAPASAMPTDPQGAAVQKRQQDMHASTVHKAKETTAPVGPQGEAAASGGGTSGGTSAGPSPKPRLQGPPTWPAYPTPLPRPAEQPVQQPVATDGGDDIGVDLPVALLIIAGTLALGGGMAVAAMKVRDHARTAH